MGSTGDTPESRFLCAVREQHEAQLEELIQSGADVNQLDEDGKTALIHAVQDGHEYCVKKLVEAGADVNQVDENGDTALILAVRAGYDDCVNVLIKAGADVNATDKHDRSALNFAVHLDHFKCVEYLANAGADVTGAVSEAVVAESNRCLASLVAAGDDVNQIHVSGFTPLTYVVERGDIDCVKLLLSLGADVNCIDQMGQTALMKAAVNDDLECVQEILNLGITHTFEAQDNFGEDLVAQTPPWHQIPDLDLQNKWDKTALMYAAEFGSDKCLVALLEAGADVNTGTDTTALMLASTEGHDRCVQLLIRANADVNYRHNDTTALVLAIKGSHKDCVNILLKAGAQMVESDFTDCPAESSIPHCVRALSSEGINVNHTIDGMTLLMRAALAGEENSLRNLVERGADLDRINKTGQTALMLAGQKGFDKCFKILILARADVNIECFKGYPALIWAANSDSDYFKQSGQAKCVDMLLQARATVKRKYLVLCPSLIRYPKLVTRMIKTGINMNIPLDGTITPLIQAVLERSEESMKSLLNANVSIDAQTHVGETALICAAIRDLDRYVEILIEAGADVNVKSISGHTALLYTMENSKYESAAALINAGANPNASTESGVSPVTVAGLNFRLEWLMSLCDPGADVIQYARGLGKALLMAVDRGQIETVKYLINAGVDVNFYMNGHTALMAAAKEGNIDIMNVLLQSGACINTAEYSVLLWALNTCTHEVCRLIIAAGADVNRRDENYGRTALMIAVYNQDEETFEDLIAAGADVNMADKKGRTALHYVTRNCMAVWDNQRSFQGLLGLGIPGLQGMLASMQARQTLQGRLMSGQIGGDANYFDPWRFVDLTKRIFEVKCGMTKSLVDKGADVNATCKRHKTPLMEMIANPDMYLGVKILIKSGAIVNFGETFGKMNTLLLEAAISAHMAKVTFANIADSALGLVLEAEVLVNIQTKGMRNALKAYLNVNGFEYANEVVVRVMIAAGELTDGDAIKIAPPEGDDEEPQMLELGDDSLKHLTREAIRKRLLDLDSHHHLFRRIPRLKLPYLLTKYLLYNIDL